MFNQLGKYGDSSGLLVSIGFKHTLTYMHFLHNAIYIYIKYIFVHFSSLEWIS